MKHQNYLRLKELQDFSRRVMESQKISHEERYYFLLGIGFELESYQLELKLSFKAKDSLPLLEEWWKAFCVYMDKLDSVAPFPE